MVTGGTSWKKSIEIMSGHCNLYQLVRNTPIWASLFPLLFVFSVQEALMLNGVGRRLRCGWDTLRRCRTGPPWLLRLFWTRSSSWFGAVSSSRAIQTAHWGREAAGGSVHLSLHLKKYSLWMYEAELFIRENKKVNNKKNTKWLYMEIRRVVWHCQISK